MHAHTIGRYQLEDLVNEFEGVSLWRGRDEVLGRPVSIRALAEDDPRVPAITAAASAAALVDDSRLVRVLDVVHAEGQVLVVSEWATGEPLNALADTPDGVRTLAPQRALEVVRDVALALNAGRAQGLVHHRLRPSCVVLESDAGNGTQLRGLAVDEAMWGALPADVSTGDPDVHGLGALLYLMVTGYWPSADGAANATTSTSTSTSASTHVREAPRINGRVLPPSHVVADVPRIVDELTSKTVIGQGREDDRFPDFATASAAFVSAADRFNPATATMAIVRPQRITARAIGTFFFRFFAILAGLALVVLFAMLGWSMIVNGPSASSDNSAKIDTSVLTAPVSIAPIQPGNPIDVAIPVVAAITHDPYGDKTENDSDTANAYDADIKTSWATDDYSDPAMSGKKGVGLVLDLGSTKPIRAVELSMASPGADVEVRVADSILKDPVLWTEIGAQTAAPQVTTMRVPRPVSGRYVLVWFTRLPAADWSYRAELNSVAVYG